MLYSPLPVELQASGLTIFQSVWLNSRTGRLRVHDKTSSQFWALRRPPGKARKRSILFLTNRYFSLTGHNKEVSFDLNYGQPTKGLNK
jgi:hypothetical protein